MSRTPSSGKNGRVTLTAEQKASKLALYRVIKDIGGLDEAEEHTRVSATQLQRYCSLHHPDCFAPADVIADLEPLATYPHVTALSACKRGYTLLERPKTEAADCPSLHAALHASMKESAESHCALMEALGHGKVTADDAKACMKEAMEAAEAHLRMHALLSRIAEEC